MPDYTEACNELSGTISVSLRSGNYSGGKLFATLCPIRPVRDLNLRPPAPDAKALLLDYEYLNITGLPQHAGRATVIRHHKGFAYDYAARRSGLGPLASSLGSADFIGETEERPDSVDGKEGSEDEKQDEKPSSKQTVQQGATSTF